MATPRGQDGSLPNRRCTLHREERGIESIEYLLIAALVIVAAAAGWRFLGQRLAANVNSVAGALDSGVAHALGDGGLGTEAAQQGTPTSVSPGTGTPSPLPTGPLPRRYTPRGSSGVNVPDGYHPLEQPGARLKVSVGKVDPP